MTFAADALRAFEFVVIVPLGLFVTLLIVRLLSWIWYGSSNRRPLPVVVHGIVDEVDSGYAENTDTTAAFDQGTFAIAWKRLPFMLRDYISADPPLSRQLAPGVGGAASPPIPSAAPGNASAGWSAALVNLVLPQRQASYDVYLTPQRDGTVFSANVQVVKTPQQWIEASKTFSDETIEGLVFQIGGFCMECIRLQLPFLRRTPRWEHWGGRGGYSLFRKALAYQAERRFEEAHRAFDEASGLSLGNIRLGVHRASLYELEGRYDEAVTLYDALHCLWRQNIEVTYRAAAARVNRAHVLLAQLGGTLDQRHGTEIVKPLEGQLNAQLPNFSVVSPSVELRLLEEADRFFAATERSLCFRYVLWRWFRTWLPRRRDVGERRYWLSWLRRDTFRQPLMLLRRSKRHEYLCAVKLAREASRLLAVLIGDQQDLPIRADSLAESPNMNESFLNVISLIKRKRIGWLAHWNAACYFSRASQLPSQRHPDESIWREYETRSRKQASLALSRNTGQRDWRQYCEDLAVQEIGRVLRNPCHQLNPQLLHSDPDMKPLSTAFKASTVRVLIGRMGQDN